MKEHIAESRREWAQGIVIGVHQGDGPEDPLGWTVDVRLSYRSSGILRRVHIHDDFLPELHTMTRQSKVLVGWVDGYQQGPVAIPLHKAIISRADKAQYIMWRQHQRWLMRIKASIATPDTPAEFEILNLTNGKKLQLRLQEQDGVIRLDTNHTRIVLHDADQSITLHSDHDLHASCRDADVQALGKVDVAAGTSATVKAPKITLDGDVSITGALAVDATIDAQGLITSAIAVVGKNIDAAGNTIGSDND